MKKEPFFQFDFLNLKTNQREQTVFKNPIKILQTTNINNINDLLKEVELAVHNGYYAAGFLSYEAASAFIDIEEPNTNSTFPLLYFAIFEAPSEIIAANEDFFEVGNWTPNITQKEYNHAFKKIKYAFDTNKTKQVNYTMQLNAHFKGDSYAYYNALKKQQHANYNAYISFDNQQILSLSPELFFDLNNDLITVKPMKGTKERGKNTDEDKQFKNELKASTKDKLENKLIVDLMIDELKAISLPDSIHLKKAFDIETFPTLFQMTSTIEAQLKPKVSFTNIFKALFPCGSITGTPKIGTMNFINKLENRSRQVYCGAIGFITPDNTATFNVPIRTVSINKMKNKARYDVGGGITNLSNEQDEYAEAFTKAEILKLQNNEFKLIETFGLHTGKYVAFQAHLNRLQSSANYFNFKLNLDKIKNDLINIAKENSNENVRVKLSLNVNGVFDISTAPLIINEKVKYVSLANKPINKQNVFLYHKTSNRSFYNNLKAEKPDVFDVILWNEQNELTEFTIGNLVIEYNGDLITPPVKSGLLPGTYRKVLLLENIITEHVITKEMLIQAENIWLINSVRKWVKVNLKKTTS